MATRSPVRTLPLALASLAEVLALAGVLLASAPIGQTGIIENDGWGVLPVLFIPAVLVLIGTIALARWESRQSSRARWSAWLVSLALLIGTLLGLGAGPYFWPAAAVLLLATSAQQKSWWALWSSSIVLVVLSVAPSISMGLDSYSWLHLAGLLLAVATVAAFRFRRKPMPQS